MAKLKTKDLVNIIDNELAASDGYNTIISRERSDALKYYYAEEYPGDADLDEGRSKAVTNDVFTTVSWALPQIIEALLQNDIVVFEALNYNDERSAILATDYAKHILFKKNNGFNIIYTAVQDALIQKNGIVKIYYDKTPVYVREEYEDLDETAIQLLEEDPDIEILKIEQEEDGEQQVMVQTLQGPIPSIIPVPKFSVTVKRKTKTEGNIKIDNVPPEELVVSRDTRSVNLDNAPFIAHRTKKSISWLRQQGYKVDDDINDGTNNSDLDYTIEKIERDSRLGTFYTERDYNPVDPSTRLVTVIEAYFKVDFDGDGIAEYRKVTKIGDKVLENEEVYCQPFVSTTPYPQSHQFYGLSMADVVKPIQKQKSMLRRALQDSFAFSISPAKAIDISSMLDLNDLLDCNSPGSWIRFRGNVPNSIMQLPSAPVSTEAFSLLEHLDQNIESTAGVSRMSQGIDLNAINRTATGTAAVMTATQQKTALLVRIFADSLLGEMYKKIIKIASIYIDAPEIIKVDSDYTEVDPRDWQTLDTISINAGTGANDRQVDLQNLQGLLQLTLELGGSGHPESMGLITPKKIHNILAKMVKKMGFKSANEFFNDPLSQEYKMMVQYSQQKLQPPPDPNLELAKAEQAKAQAAADSAAQKMLVETATFELEKLKADREFELAKMELALKYDLELAKLGNKEAQERVKASIGQTIMTNPSQTLLPQSELATIQEVITIQRDNQIQEAKKQQALEQEAQAQQAQAQQMPPEGMDQSQMPPEMPN